jgi:NAD(P)H-dependent FMN reductase
VSKPVLQVIVCSTRPGRVGVAIASWFYEIARLRDYFEVEFVDLVEYDLPLLDEPVQPFRREYTHDHTRRWSETVTRGDAFVFVIPEYNHSFNGAVKNALDYLHTEWAYKPVGFVSYGGVAAGTRALQALKPVVSALRMTPVMEAVNIPFVAKFIDDDGRFVPNELLLTGAADMLAELAKVEAALRPLRTAATD